MKKQKRPRIAIAGGGPTALFILKHLAHRTLPEATVDILESSADFGAGMPYSKLGAAPEHVTNVSGNEIPELPENLLEWFEKLPEGEFQFYELSKSQLHEYKVVPRLLFGKYLSAQFDTLCTQLIENGISLNLHPGTEIVDVRRSPNNPLITLHSRSTTQADQKSESLEEFDFVVVATGHEWPKVHEGKVDGWFDSPYPPEKLKLKLDHEIALKGCSLSAIDAIRTLARANGEFTGSGSARRFICNPESPSFRITMHSRDGFLPGVRFHLEDPMLRKTGVLSEAEINRHRLGNDGFVSLDFLFEKNFKAQFRTREPKFYDFIKSMNLEEFVGKMLEEKERTQPFELFRREYEIAIQSIKDEDSIYWKEKLAILSSTLNQPAKFFSAEDYQRLETVLMPLVSLVIAFVPQCSCEDLLALYDAGCLDLVAVGDDGEVRPGQLGAIYEYSDAVGERVEREFRTYVDCSGQKSLSFEDLPFPSLQTETMPARLKFRTTAVGGEAKSPLTVPGVAITDDYQAIDQNGNVNKHLFIAAIPFIGGYNPDYSGLDVSDEIARRIVGALSNN